MSDVSNAIIIGSIPDNNKVNVNNDITWFVFDSLIVEPNATTSMILDTMGKYINIKFSGYIKRTPKEPKPEAIPIKLGKRTKQI